MGQMLNYIKKKSCLFPIQLSEIDEKTAAHNKLNYLCNNTSLNKWFADENSKLEPAVVGVEAATTTSTALPQAYLCVTVADVVYKICNKTTGFLQTTKKDIIASLEDKTSDPSENTKAFCEKLVNTINTNGPKAEELPSEEIKNFYGDFLLKINQKDDNNNYCTSICKNVPLKSIKGDDNLKINPLCLLLKSGYDVLRKVVDRVNPVVDQGDDEFKAPVSVSSSSPSIPNNKPVNPKKSARPALLAPATNIENHGTNNNPPDQHLTTVDKNSDDMQASRPTIQDNQNQAAAADGKLDLTDSSASHRKVEEKQPVKSSTTSTVTSVGFGPSSNGEEEVPEPPHADKSSPASPVNSPAPEKIPKDDSQNKPAFNNNNNPEKEKPQQKVDEKTNSQAEKPRNQELGGGVENFDGDNSSGENLDENNANLDLEAKELSYGDGISPKQQPKKSNTIFITDPVRNINFEESAEEESGGFFNYFLFFVTFLALGFIVFHNKRRLIAFVVEGRKPRGTRSRSRRSSSASSATSYRRLENNFE